MSMKVKELVKAYTGVLLGKPDYWHPRFKVNEHLDKNVLGKYYLDMSSKADYPGKFDVNDVPLLLLNNQSYHLPVTIAQFGLGNYDKYQTTKEDKYLKSVFDAANWFVNNCSIIDSSCAWYNYYENRLYSIKAPWVSAISQGQGISVLVRAFRLSQKQQYLDIALTTSILLEENN